MIMRLEKNLDNHFTPNLLSFFDRSPTPYQVVANVEDILGQNGFHPLNEREPWRLEKEGKYYVKRNGTSLVAFEVGRNDVTHDGFRIIAAHTDAPTFKIKPGRCTVTPDGYVKLNVEPYGGAIYSSWFDRPLAIAGRVIMKTDDAMRPEVLLADIHEPVVVIPNLAIHMNRQVNSGQPINVQADMLPLIGRTEPGVDGGTFLQSLLAERLQVRRRDILDYDLFLYEVQPGCRLGDSGEYISASRIDNLASVFAGVDGIAGSSSFGGVKVMVAFDNEEVGSGTRSGADGDFLPGIFRRIAIGLGLGEEGLAMALANSLAVSADAAHAVHPNFPDRHDPENRPVVGGGPTIKYMAAQKYATDGLTASVFSGICASAGIPVQRFVNRSDVVAGSTLGPMLSRHLSIPTVDVGAPILAMHSIRELANASDIFFMAQAFRHFYEYSAD